MRKILWVTVLLLALLCCACAAADTSYSLAPCPGTVEIPDAKFIVLTPDNLTSHPDLLSRIGKTAEQLTADWEERGVIMQAWFQSKKPDSCLEISVREDADSKLYYDLVSHSTDQNWKSFISSHKDGSVYAGDGYSLREVAKKQQANKNYFLRFQYKRTTDEKVYWGYVAKTVARGYTIVFDYQVFDRGLRAGDQTQLNRIVNTLSLSEGGIASGSSVSESGNLSIITNPPVETNVDTFTVEGRTIPGLEVIGVLMNEEKPEPTRFYATANEKNGSFKLKVTLPYEKTWLLTLSVVDGDNQKDFHAFSPVKYSKTLLPLTFDSAVPETLTASETVISGTTDKGVTVQCIVSDGGKTNFTKQIKTNGTGTFKFKVSTAVEGSYDFVLSFQKKGLNNVRKSFTSTRTLTAADNQARANTKAIHPAYKALMNSMDSYIGKTMVYSVHIVNVTNNTDQWVIQAALKKNRGTYSNFVYYIADTDPGLEPGTKVKVYGVFTGGYPVQSEEDIVTFPGFDYVSYE